MREIKRMDIKNMNSRPFFSVIVPVYNQERYVSECIESVLAQTFKEFELILVDDGSVDLSGKICDQYAQQYPQFVSVTHKENEGPLIARYEGIKIAHGRYYLFLDSDDTFLKNALEIIHDKLEETSTQLLIFNATYDQNFISKVNKYPFLDGEVIERKEFLISFCGTHMFNSMAFKCVHRSLFDENYCDYKKYRLNYGEDLFQSIPIVDKVDKVCIMQQPLYFYRQHQKSATHHYYYAHFESIKIVCERLIEYSNKWENEYSLKLKEKALEYAGNECYRTAKNILKSNDNFQTKKRNLSELRKDLFYNQYIRNQNMRQHLKIYERFILCAVESDSNMLLWILNSIFMINNIKM